MKKLILLFCFFSSSVAIAQQGRSIIPASTPLVVVNGKVVEFSYHFDYLKLILPTDIEKIEILQPAAATALYGVRASNGVVLLILKPSIKLLSYHQLLKKFKVKKADRQYIPYIGNQPIDNTSDFYASETWIKEIRKQNRNNGMSIIPYLNIIVNR